MSTIAEKGREEADRAEAEDERTEGEAPGETSEEEEAQEAEEAAAPAVAAPTPEDLEKRFKQLDNEHQRHEKRVREILGADFETLTACPLCWTDGYALPVPIDQRPPEQVQAVQAILGAPQEPEYKSSPRHAECGTCDGWGKVLSGAKNPENRTVACPTCRTLGYIDKEGQIVSPTTGVPPAPVANGKDPLQEQLEARGFTVIPPYVPPVPA